MMLPDGQMTVQMQAVQFLESCLLGLPAGILLECFRTLRALLPHHAVTVFIEDTLYSFAACFMLQCFAWMFADGVLRWYHAAGALLGLTVWLLTAGAVWARMLFRLRHFTRKTVSCIRRILSPKEKQENNPEST